MKTDFTQLNFRTARELIERILKMIQVDSGRKYDEIRKIKTLYQIKFFYSIAPFSFVNPANGWYIEISTSNFRPVLIKAADGSWLGQDCYLYGTNVSLGTSISPMMVDVNSALPAFWFNYSNGILIEVLVFYPIDAMAASYVKEDGIWRQVYNMIGEALPDDLALCDELLGQPLPFRINCDEKLTEFFDKSGLLGLHRELDLAWPCENCGKPKKDHGDDQDEYLPLALV